MFRVLVPGLVLTFLCCSSASADTFDEYQLAESVTLPGGGGVFDFLNDGRMIVLAIDEVYIETAIRSREFVSLGTLADAEIPPFGAAFLRASPDGQRVAVGNNGFGAGAAVGLFELVADGGVIDVTWYEVQHFEAAWYDDDILLLTAGFGETVVTALDFSDPDNAINTTIIANVGGASAGVAVDGEGNLFTGNGFQINGPSETGWIKAFTHADWTAVLKGAAPLDFEADGVLVVDVLSASALGFDGEGNLHVGGGDFGTGDLNYAAVVRASAVANALDDGGPADPDDSAQVRRLDPDGKNGANFYDVNFNAVSCGLFIREGDALYAYQGTSPFAAQVVEYVEGTGVGNDFISGDPFNDPTTALGRPTVDTTGDGFNIPLDESVPLVAVNSAFRAFEIVSVGSGGHLTLKFNHPVQDDACNPYGVDFIIFGNSFHLVGGGAPWANDDPNMTTVSGALFAEPGLVSVSQDGLVWFVFDDGPFADDFAPTLGRIYDPENPDPKLGEWNEWWGQPTDPTRPLDPTLMPTILDGLSVADAAEFYDGSAGGTGFDLAALGLDWIQYVRIEHGGSGVPEIDAIADVASAVGGSDADLDGDGMVGAADLDLLLGSWGPCDCCPADLDGNGTVGAFDLALLLGDWG